MFSEMWFVLPNKRTGASFIHEGLQFVYPKKFGQQKVLSDCHNAERIGQGVRHFQGTQAL
jgi:hypothetical protein